MPDCIRRNEPTHYLMYFRLSSNWELSHLSHPLIAPHQLAEVCERSERTSAREFKMATTVFCRRLDTHRDKGTWQPSLSDWILPPLLSLRCGFLCTSKGFDRVNFILYWIVISITSWYVRSDPHSPIIIGMDLISGLCFTCDIPDHMCNSPVVFTPSHLQLSTVHWATPELSEWFLRLLEPLIHHLCSNFRYNTSRYS